METEQIKQMATDVNNVAAASFQSGQEDAKRSLLAKIDRLEKRRDSLLSTIQNALVFLAIIHMPVQEDNLANVMTNEELLKVMADSFREALKENDKTNT